MRERGRHLAVHAAHDRVVALVELDPADVAQANRGGTFLAGAHDDVLELLGLGEQALRGDHEGLLRPGHRRLAADLADAERLVLALQRGGHLLHGDAELRHAVRLQPYPHRDVGQPEHRSAVGARDPLQLVEHVQVRVVVDVRRRIAVVGRVDRQHHHDGRRLLVDRRRPAGSRFAAAARAPG